MYFLAASNASKSLSVADLYNNSGVLNGNSESESRSKFDKKWNQLYPRTGELRKRIIKANRISMDKTTPKAKWSYILNYARTTDDYIKDYPKTFRTRYFLITKGQIIDGQVTQKGKGFFSRFLYKRFIKDGFSFKK